MSLRWQNWLIASFNTQVSERGVKTAVSLRAGGFTVVELVTTIILLAILSGVAMSSMVSPSSFGPSTIAHQLGLEFSVAYGQATARQDVTVSVEIQGDTDAWLVRISNSADGVVRTTSLDALGTSITVTNGLSSSSLSGSDALTLSFSGSGEVASAALAGSIIDPSLGIQIDLAGESNRVMCLYPTGYLDDAACA